jgi:hypothetical protein
MSETTVTQPRITTHAPRRIAALVVATVALVAALAIAVAVFAWTVADRSEPAPPTLPSVQADQGPSSDADVLPAGGVPVLDESCQPRQACAF